MSLDDPAANAVAVSPSHPPTLAAEAELAPCFAPPSTTRRSGPLVPMILGAALFMQMLDSTIVANALPTMARSFHEDPVTLNMAITAYLLAAAMFLPISAWLADRFGARLVFRAAIAGFAASSMLCGLAQNLPEFVLARMLQGCTGALLMPVGRLVLLRSVPKSELVSAMAFLTLPALLGPILGPPIGGLIVTFWSWRWVFFINVPMGVLGVLLATLYMPEVREETRQPLDLRGLVLTAAGLAGIVYGFSNLGGGELSTGWTATLLGGGTACLLLYLVHARRTPHAILDLSLMRIQTYGVSQIGGLFGRLAIGASPFLLALLFQLGFGLSAFAAGMLTFATALGALAMKATAVRIIRLFGFKTVLIGNSIIVAATSGACALFRATTPHWLMFATLFVSGFFRSLHFSALNALGFADVPHSAMSRASSLQSVFQQLTQSFGIGLAAVLIRLTVAWHGNGPLQATDITPAFAIIAALGLVSILTFLPLPANAGAEVSGHNFSGGMEEG